MADAEKLLGSDRLRDAYPKINDAIDNANSAKTQSDSAVNTANQALSNSESTQEQLDTIVIEGDSSVEAAQARVVDVGGETATYQTLKERLDDQLAGTAFLELLFGIVGDGVADDSTAIQNYANFCLRNNRKVKLSAKKYYVPAPIVINNTDVPDWSIFEIEGELSGSAVSVTQSNSPGTTIITNGNSAFEFEFFSFYNESVKLSHLSFHNTGAIGTSVAIHYKFNQSAYARKQIIKDVNVVNFDKAIEFLGMSATFNDNYFGTSVVDLLHTYQCNTSIHFNNTFANLFECKNSLLHGATTGAVLFSGVDGGGIMAFSNTHIEGAEPAGIIPGPRLLTLSLHDFSSESTGDTSGFGLFDLSNSGSTSIKISGNFGINLMPDFSLDKNCNLSVSDTVVSIRAKGGLVLTPEMVKLSSDDYSFAMFPLDKMRKPYRNKALNRFAGTQTGLVPSYDSEVPSSLLTEYTFVSGATVYDHRTSFGASASNCYLIASFITQRASDGLLGFDTTSQFILDSVTTNINSEYVQTVKYPVVVVLMIPIDANQDLSRLSLAFRSPTWATPAWVSLEDTTRSMVLSSLGHPRNEELEEVVTIANGGSYTFKETGLYQASYAVDASLLINNGKDGFVDYKFYGIAQNGSKYVDKVGASKLGTVTLTTADGAHTDLYNLTVSNASGASITVSLRTKYRS